MKISRATATILLVMGAYMLFTWGTRAYTWYANDLQEQTGYVPFIHLVLILISVAIGGYLTYLGIKGRRATRRSGLQ